MFFIDYHQFADNRQLLSFYKKWANVLNNFDLPDTMMSVTSDLNCMTATLWLLFSKKRVL